MPLKEGDYISATLGINMPLDDSGRSSPWIKAEVSANVKITKSGYKSALKRLNADVKKRLDSNINYLIDELRKSK